MSLYFYDGKIGKKFQPEGKNMEFSIKLYNIAFLDTRAFVMVN